VPVKKLSVPLHVFVPDREPDLLTDSHVKLYILVDTQEPLSTSHHRIAFDYDEDTVSLVVDPTLSTLYISISNNSNSSAGNASAFEHEYAMRLRMTHLDSTAMGQRSRSLNRNHL
jgi:hypothetical protein